MNIRHDYSYLGDRAKLIEKGYAEMNVHSLNFERYYTEERKMENAKLAEKLSRDEWSNHCDEVSKEVYKKILIAVDLLNSRYDLHQIDEEKSSTEHYKSDWDLHFYSNKGWNGKDYFDYVSISFNEKRTLKENKKLLNEILLLLEGLEIENVCCRVQYGARVDEEMVKGKAIEICEGLLEKTIEYKGITGKIKVVSEHESEKTYGFFKSRARSKYYSISNKDIILSLA